MSASASASRLPTGAGISVVVRVRPLNDIERSKGDTGDGVRCLDDRSVQIGPRQLTFDAALSGSDQAEIFERTEMRALLDASLQGYAATVFAYGQTGSGKTFTMSGPDLGSELEGAGAGAATLEGIIPRSVRHLFDTLESHRAAGFGRSYAMSASYLEIYNEQINDLLNANSTNLPIRWNTQQGFFVEGLLVVDCETVDELMMVFQEGTKNRKVGSHQLNKDSSRSHAIMQVQVTSREMVALDQLPGMPEADLQSTVETHGRLSFVDLAGSERLHQSGSVGGAARETAHINKSLLVLGKVISALSAGAESGRPMGHVPYRDSKLTKLLADSLGGSSMAMMIGCVSPSAMNADESANTLHYLSAAKKIQNRPVVQMNQASGMAASLKSLRDEVQGLREENMALHQQLSALSLGDIGGRSTPPQMARQMSLPEHEQLVRKEREAAEMQHELQRLRAQNGHLQMANNLIQRSYDEVKRENDALQDKLERLERIFVDTSNGEQ